MVGHKRERVLGRVGRAVDAAARDFAREAAQLENGGGREAAAERLVEQQVEVVALDKDRVVVETAMRLDVAVLQSGALTSEKPFGSLLIVNPVSRVLLREYT